jgi:hypothetical protein
VTPDLLTHLITTACVRVGGLEKAKRDALARLIECGAWTEAALALIDVELPGWKLRRLVYEDGAWLCSLSKQVNLPMWLDDTADARHDVLPLAILGALLEAKSRVIAPKANPSAVPRVQPMSGIPISCENFS